MAQKIGKEMIKNLKPPERGNIVIYDTQVPGFGVRTTAAGAKSYVFNYRNKTGRERRLTIGPCNALSVTAAREEAKRLRGEVALGGDPLGDERDKRTAPTVKDLAKEFREVLKTHKGAPWITAFPHCLVLFPAEEFEDLSTRLSEASRAIDSIQRLKRLILGMAARAPFDKQGRILIPPKLRKWGGLEREIVFTGVGKSIEVWDRARHEADLEQTRGLFPEFTDLMKEFGL